MNVKIISILAIGWLLITCISTANAFKIEEKETRFLSTQNQEYYEWISLEGITTDTGESSHYENTGGLDLIVSEMIAWRSPTPWPDEKWYNYTCWNCLIKNIGETYQSEEVEYLKITVYYIYLDHEEKFSSRTDPFITIKSDEEITYFQWSALWPVPLDVRLEVETTVEETNMDNNEKAAPVGPGVMIYGNVYSIDQYGEENLLEDALLRCLADESHFSIDYGQWAFMGSTYILPAPLKSGSPPYKYTIYARYLLKIQLKETEPLYENDCTQIDFIFKLSKDINKPFFNFLQNHPFLFKLIQKLLNF